jgi:23S rRNA (pseudouridine1915-N3)-methyltransferase
MLKINIIAIGKNKDGWVGEAINHYITLLKKHAAVTLKVIPDMKGSRSLSPIELKIREASRIGKHIHSNHAIALSDKGRKYTSEEFAELLQKIMNSSGKVDFIIGGIYGLDETILKKCREIISLSPMTFSHQLVRPILLEQLYRGFSILNGGSYHK